VPAELGDRAQRAAADLLADRVDGRRPAEREADRGDLAGAGGGPRRHGLAVGHRRGQRFLAQHVLARVQQGLDDLPVQPVGHHHADRVDVAGPGDGLPAGLGALVAVPPGGVRGERLVRVGDGDQPDVRQAGAEDGRRRPVAAGVCPPGHAGADHRHPDRSAAHGASRFKAL
jgi:hypothetical protein